MAGARKMGTLRKLGMSALVVVVGMAAFAGTSGAQANSNLNQPSYYEGLGYGTCTKTEPVSTPYTLGAPPAGSYWRLLVLKAGSAASNDDWNTMIDYPAPGIYSHPSGKNISHVIRCSKPGTPPGATTTTAAPTTTAAGGSCTGYTPTQVAVSPQTIQPGDNVTVTGNASPGAVVTVKATKGSTTIDMGTAVAGPSGAFSVTYGFATNVQPGNYTITVSVPGCPATTVTLVIAPLTFSGCGANNDGRTFSPGEDTVWQLHSSSFSTSSPVELRLYKTGYSQVLYSGPWPAANEQLITIPANAPQGQYTMEQTGTKSNGKGTMSKTCPVWVDNQFNFVVSTSAPTAGASSSDGGLPIAEMGIGLVAALALVQLRRRSAARA